MDFYCTPWYNVNMDNIEKFYSDVKRIVKLDRAHNAGTYDGIRASKAVAKHFVSQYRDLGELPFCIADYWEQTYIQNTQKKDDEPSDVNVTWLAAAMALLDGEFLQNASDQEKNAFSNKDWKELCNLVNYEAEDLPLDLLTSLMSVFTEKKVL